MSKSGAHSSSSLSKGGAEGIVKAGSVFQLRCKGRKSSFAGEMP